MLFVPKSPPTYCAIELGVMRPGCSARLQVVDRFRHCVGASSKNLVASGLALANAVDDGSFSNFVQLRCPVVKLVVCGRAGISVLSAIDGVKE